MAIREFELFHGAALTRILRSDKPMTLRMIETRPGEAWGAYVINDEVTLMMKHSATPKKMQRNKGALRWVFTIGSEHIRQLSAANVWLVLVCGSSKLASHMEICLLNPEDIGYLIDKSSLKQQAITVKYFPRMSLRVSSAMVEEFAVSRNRLEKWEPASMAAA